MDAGSHSRAHAQSPPKPLLAYGNVFAARI